ncbi:Bug family tripartite tricarboxylate transporter substrate binding protein [Cupriavidus sp. 30B13]|uniref:Bug family tripartite tricarboxylate transporter substrate binding protein n=1 Tax=Cupriavidus sp. 30B13 TaxID=3384241 RepID=UPI003B904ED2
MTPSRWPRHLAALLLACASALAQAQAYPSKPVRIVVPYAPGGGVDAMTRRVAQKLTVQTGTTFYVENKAGASGTIGTAQVARAAPDGTTLLANDGTYTMLPYVFKTLTWDHANDLVPVTTTSVSPALLAVGPNTRFATVAELVRYAKAHPGEVTYGTGGVGSSLHFATEQFAQAAGISLRHIPFKGAGEAVAAVAAGTVDICMGGPSSALALVQGGKLRALAVSGSHRLAVLPQVPTFEESGIRYEMSYWTGLAAPKGTPPEIVAFLRKEVAKSMEEEDMRAYYASIGADAGGMPAAEFATFMRNEVGRWKSVAAAAGIKPE